MSACSVRRVAREALTQDALTYTKLEGSAVSNTRVERLVSAKGCRLQERL